MSSATRRGFLAMTGAGAAVVAAPGVVAPAAAQAPAGAVKASGPLVAYVRDVRGGAVSIMVGDREVVVHDRDLVARLAGLSAAVRE
jgi:hypothetical protein